MSSPLLSGVFVNYDSRFLPTLRPNYRVVDIVASEKSLLFNRSKEWMGKSCPKRALVPFPRGSGWLQKSSLLKGASPQEQCSCGEALVNRERALVKIEFACPKSAIFFIKFIRRNC